MLFPWTRKIRPEMDVSGHESEEKTGIKFGADTQKTAPLK